MPDSSVSSCVLNILGSFSSSLGLYKKLKEKRQRLRRSRKAERIEAEEELRLSRSLRQGSEDISREYHNNVYTAGDQFAIGDAIAQTSLAEVLLRLNVGLVGIITSFLNSDQHNVQLDYKSLTDLSERSRIDTCRALRQLYKRLTHFRPPRAITSREDAEAVSNVKAASTSDLSGNKKRNKPSNNRPKIRGPTLAQVVIQDSSKPPQLAIVRPGERRKKSRSSSSSELTSSHTRHDSKTHPPATTTTPPEYTTQQHHNHHHRPAAPHARPSHDTHKQHQKQSSTNLATLPFLDPPPSGPPRAAARSTPRLETTLHDPLEPLPPIPNTAPLPSPAALSTPLLVPRRRKPTPTYYSIATDSTKLGEIPLHKWTVPYDFDRMSLLNREAYRDGWPNARKDVVQGRTKRVGLFGLFRRKE